MKKGIVFIAPLGARNKKAAVFDEIISLCPDNDYSQVLYITPSAFSASETKQQFFRYLKSTCGKSSYIPFRSFTLSSLCKDIYETYGKQNIISDRIEPLIFCELLGEKNIGYAKYLSDLLRMIRHYISGKELSQIKEDIKALIFEEKTMKRAVNAMGLLELYEKEIKKKELIDFGCAFKNSIAMIKEHITGQTAVFDGFFDPTPLEMEAVSALIEKTDNVYVLVEENAEFLSFFPKDDSVAASSLEFKGAKFKVRKLKPSYSRNAAGYYAYPSMEDEVEGIARGVKGLIIEGVKPNEITVSFPLLSKYTPMLKRNFRKHGIPVSIAEYDISVSRQIMVIEEMIASIEDDYPRNEFISFLTSVHLPKIPAVIKEFAIFMSNRAGIIKGKNEWLTIKETILNSAEEDMSEGEKEILNEFQRQLKHIISALEKLRQEKSLALFIDAVEEILHRFGFFDLPEERRAPQALGGVQDTVNRILSELKQFSGLYGLDDTGFGDASFYFRQMLKGLKGRDRNAVGVRVVPLELAAGIESRALFFGGMTESDLPSKPAIDPVLPEKVKKEIGFPYLEYYLNRQKRYFHRLLNVSSSDPYFSCPSADGDKIFLPSPFLDWNQAASPPTLNISTEEDILIGEGAALNLKNETGAGAHFGAKATGILRRRIGAMSKRYFRVTDIDYYRKCPFRFYLEKILGLEIEKPPRFEVEYRQWGILAHKTMEHLFDDKEWEPDDFEKRLFTAVEKSLKEIPINKFWADVTRGIFRNLLPLLKKQESEIRMRGFGPWLVEEKIEAEIDGIKLRGKIDRIDIQKGRRDEGRGKRDENKDKVVLLDYKTGSIDRDSLQLPLYAAMWQKTHPQQIYEAGYYSLKDGRVTWYPPKKKSIENFIQEALRETSALIGQMKKGMFPAEPVNNECRNCNHGALCKNK